MTSFRDKLLMIIGVPLICVIYLTTMIVGFIALLLAICAGGVAVVGVLVLMNIYALQPLIKHL